jgi:hypothetical protein
VVVRRAAARAVLDQDAGHLLPGQVRQIVSEDGHDGLAPGGVGSLLPEAGVKRACCDDGGEGYRAAQRTEAVATIELHDLGSP